MSQQIDIGINTKLLNATKQYFNEYTITQIMLFVLKNVGNTQKSNKCEILYNALYLIALFNTFDSF